MIKLGFFRILGVNDETSYNLQFKIWKLAARPGKQVIVHTCFLVFNYGSFLSYLCLLHTDSFKLWCKFISSRYWPSSMLQHSNLTPNLKLKVKSVEKVAWICITYRYQNEALEGFLIPSTMLVTSREYMYDAWVTWNKDTNLVPRPRCKSERKNKLKTH